MHVHRLLLVPAILALLACDKTEPAPAPVASETPKPVEEPKPKREPAADLESKALLDAMKCGAKSQDGCVALSAFEGAKRWDLGTIRSEDARYFGKAWVHKDGEVTQTWAFLVVKKVPLNQVQEGDLPIKVALRTLEDASPSTLAHAEKLHRILERDDAVNKLNNAAEHVKTYAPARWDGAAQTKGVSSVMFIDAGAYVREGDKRVLHVVKLDTARPGAMANNGMFATLYPLSW